MVAGRIPPSRTDVFIVGGGPAGLATAIAARQHGLEVTVADGAETPIDKTCGEGVMPNGVAALRELGVTIPPHESMPFRESASSARAALSTPPFGTRPVVVSDAPRSTACWSTAPRRWE